MSEGSVQQLSLSLAPTRVESAIDRAEKRLRALQQINVILREFPEIAAELGIGDGSTATPKSLPPRDGSLSNFERIRNYFVRHSNQWEQAPRIGNALGMSRGTVATVLWTSHRDQFEQSAVDGSIKKKKWRLLPDVFQDAKTQI